MVLIRLPVQYVCVGVAVAVAVLLQPSMCVYVASDQVYTLKYLALMCAMYTLFAKCLSL